MSSLGNKQIMAKNIKRLMDAKGIDRYALCDDLNIKYTTLADWVNGRTYPRIDSIERMANYFGVSKSDLVEDADESDQEKKEPVQSDERRFNDPVESGLSDIYFSLAKDLQDAKIDPEDIRNFAKIISRNIKRAEEDHD